MNKFKTFFKNLIIEIKKVVSKHIDKIAHILTTYSVTFTIAHFWNINAAIAIGILAGVLKEFVDKWLGGKFSVWDIVADIIGIVFAYFMFTL